MDINSLFKNYPHGADSEESASYDSQLNGMVGGFPPIYICIRDKTKSDTSTNRENIKREYKTHKTAISIKTLLEKRRATHILS